MHNRHQPYEKWGVTLYIFALPLHQDRKKPALRRFRVFL
ncbi:hypothetical protein B4113_2857 [Geobacillus sp. B4113_201601]|nr:hypothetical protein B4113_2857 [Geobacillus sp. B4113_201601]